jgi:hypothetical protein
MFSPFFDRVSLIRVFRKPANQVEFPVPSQSVDSMAALSISPILLPAPRLRAGLAAAVLRPGWTRFLRKQNDDSVRGNAR